MTGSAPAHELNFIRAVIAYSRNHDLNQASTYLESALTDQPSHYDSLMLQGRIFEAEKLSDKALTSYLRAAKAAPGCPGAFLRLGMAYRRRGDADKARRCLQKAYSLDGGSEEAGAMLSDVYREQVRKSSINSIHCSFIDTLRDKLVQHDEVLLSRTSRLSRTLCAVLRTFRPSLFCRTQSRFALKILPLSPGIELILYQVPSRVTGSVSKGLTHVLAENLTLQYETIECAGNLKFLSKHMLALF